MCRREQAIAKGDYDFNGNIPPNIRKKRALSRIRELERFQENCRKLRQLDPDQRAAVTALHRRYAVQPRLVMSDASPGGGGEQPRWTGGRGAAAGRQVGQCARCYIECIALRSNLLCRCAAAPAPATRQWWNCNSRAN